MFKAVKNPVDSSELKEIISILYGEQVSIQELIESTLTSKNATLSIINQNNTNLGYVVWLIETEIDDETSEKTMTLIIDEIVVLPDFHNAETALELILDTDTLAKAKDCSMIEITLPSHSFWLIPVFIEEGKYITSALRVTKELEKRTEFVQIFNKSNESIKPEFIEVMASKAGDYQLAIIEEPKDYRKLLEEGSNPEIISMIFYLEVESVEESMKKINSIAEWQEYSISLVKMMNE